MFLSFMERVTLRFTKLLLFPIVDFVFERSLNTLLYIYIYFFFFFLGLFFHNGKYCWKVRVLVRFLMLACLVSAAP